MVRRIWLPFFIAWMLLIVPTALAANEAEDFEQFMNERYVNKGWSAESVTQWGDAAAAVLYQGDKGLLVVRKGEHLIENTDAVLSSGYTIHMDTEDLLYLTVADGKETTTYDFYYVHNRWLLGGIRYTGQGPSERDIPIIEEILLNMLDDEISTDYLLEDENENILWRETTPPLPDVLTEDELDLANWSPFTCPVYCTGYMDRDLGDSSDIVRKRLFDRMKTGTFFADDAYVDGLINRDTLQFIADKPNGSRVLLCGSFAEDTGWQFVESSPLPAGTTMGVENFTSNLYFPTIYGGPSVQRFADGIWGVSSMISSPGELYFMGQNWISLDGNPVWSEYSCYGEHPWSDITAIDWNSIPLTAAEAQGQLDLGSWATPNSSNPEDRLHLREKAEKGSRSLGKFYNGAPVKVLKRGQEWTKVQIGPMTGYMMTKYLAFGNDMKKVKLAVPYKDTLHLTIAVTWLTAEGNTHTQILPGERIPSHILIGIHEDLWFFWDYMSNSFGQIQDSDLWDGNG